MAKGTLLYGDNDKADISGASAFITRLLNGAVLAQVQGE